MITFTIDLTPEQKKHLDSIRWLLQSWPRAQGKTYLMAIIFIEEASKNIGQYVRVFDHNEMNQNNYEHMLHMIVDLFDSAKGNVPNPLTGFRPYILKIDKRNHRIKIDYGHK